jgi:hypothetical protein
MRPIVRARSQNRLAAVIDVIYPRAMKLIAHRGWSEGPQENSTAAFLLAAEDERIAGVEFDVRRVADSGALVVSHDPPPRALNVLSLDAALELLAPTRLELYVEIKEPGLAEAVIERLVAYGLAGRALVFAFAPVAASFPWQGRRPVRLGIIAPYPWQLARIVREHAPDVLLLGWDGRAWTRLAFRLWWSVFSLDRMARRHGKPVVAGIVQRTGDLDWLARQSVDAAVADMDAVA